MNIGASEALVLAGFLGVAVAMVWALTRVTRRSSTRAWATAHGVSHNDDTAPIAHAYLRRSATWRLSGAIIGVVLPLGTDVPGLEMIAGYLIGAIASEVTASPVATADRPRASLVPRELRQYLPGYTLAVFRTVGLAAAAVALCWYLIPLRGDGSTEAALGPVAAAAGALILLIVVEASLRYIVRRPQPAGDPALIELDDAIRAASMHATVGAGIGIAFLLLGAALWAVGFRTDIQLIRWVAPFAGVFCLGAGISFWMQLGHDTPWRVERAHRPQVSA